MNDNTYTLIPVSFINEIGKVFQLSRQDLIENSFGNINFNDWLCAHNENLYNDYMNNKEISNDDIFLMAIEFESHGLESLIIFNMAELKEALKEKLDYYKLQEFDTSKKLEILRELNSLK